MARRPTGIAHQLAREAVRSTHQTPQPNASPATGGAHRAQTQRPGEGAVDGTAGSRDVSRATGCVVQPLPQAATPSADGAGGSGSGSVVGGDRAIIGSDDDATGKAALPMGVFEIDEILNDQHRKKKRFYFVKWKGFAHKHNTVGGHAC